MELPSRDAWQSSLEEPSILGRAEQAGHWSCGSRPRDIPNRDGASNIAVVARYRRGTICSYPPSARVILFLRIAKNRLLPNPEHDLTVILPIHK